MQKSIYPLGFFGALALGAGALVIGSIPPAMSQGGPSPEARAVIQNLSDEERQKFFALPREERRAFIQKKLAAQNAGGGSAPGGGQASQRPQRPQGGPGGGQGAGRPGGGPAAGRPGGGRPGGFGGRRRPPPLVELGDVLRENLIRTVPITGRLVAKQRGAIASRIAGRISAVLVDVGDRVEKGQVLARIETDRFKLNADLKSAEVNQARAKLNSAKATVELLKQELKRIEGLRRSAAFSQARYEDKRQEIVKARASVDENAAALRRARASRDMARLDVKDAQIRAPFAGVVINRKVSAGAFVGAGAAIATLLDDRTMEVEADIPSDRLSGIAEGSELDVALGDGKSIKASIRAIIPDEDPLARTRAVRLTPRFGANSDVVPNQSVVIQVPRGQRREVVTVAKDAIVSRQTGPIVFVFQQGRVRPAQVRIGEGFGSKFEILAGLRPGMKVVVRGNEMLRPGQNVRVARSGPGGGPGGGNPQAGAIIQSLSDEERRRFFAMSGPEKGAFIRAKLAERNARGGPQGARQGPRQGAGQGGGQAARGPGGGGPGGRNPQAGAIIRSLSDEERRKFFAMSGPEKGAFIRAKLAERNAGGGGPQGARQGAGQGTGQGGGQAARGPGGGGPSGGQGGGQGGRGPSPEARAVIQGLSDEERRKFFAMPRAERRAFIQQKLSRQ